LKTSPSKAFQSFRAFPGSAGRKSYWEPFWEWQSLGHEPERGACTPYRPGRNPALPSRVFNGRAASQPFKGRDATRPRRRGFDFPLAWFKSLAFQAKSSNGQYSLCLSGLGNRSVAMMPANRHTLPGTTNHENVAVSRAVSSFKKWTPVSTWGRVNRLQPHDRLPAVNKFGSSQISVKFVPSPSGRGLG